MYRAQRALPLVDALTRDVRYGLRRLRRDPLFALVAVVSIALGVGATTIAFSFLQALLLNPFPYQGADRMFWIAGLDKTGLVEPVPLSRAEFIELQSLRIVDGAIIGDQSPMTVFGGDFPEAVEATRLSSNAFSYFGVPPLLGRTLTIQDGPPGQEAQPVVVVSHGFWQRHFGGSHRALGAAVRIDDRPYQVVGVLPQRFPGMFSATELYVPLPLLSTDPTYRALVQVRLRPDVTATAAESELQRVLDRLARDDPGRFPADLRVRLKGIKDARTDQYAGTLVPIFAAAMLLLAVGCLNVSILLLARGATRSAELAVRGAIGASRGRLVRQLMTEALLLAVCGSALGVLCAAWAIPATAAWLPWYVPPGTTIPLDRATLLFSATAAIAAALLFGVVPAFRLSRASTGSLVRDRWRTSSTVSHKTRLFPVLIAGQVALIVILLATAGAAVGTFMRVYRVELGYEPRHLLRLTLLVPRGSSTTWSERQRFSERLREQIGRTPGVESVTVGQVPPVAGGRLRIAFPDRPSADDQLSLVQRISAEYFSTLKIPLVRGRLWTRDDDARAAHVAVINQAMAQRFWPSGDPIGQRVRLPEFTAAASWSLPPDETTAWLDIVGVVANTPNVGLRSPAAPALYIPSALMPTSSEYLVIRTTGDPSAAMAAIRAEVRTVDAAAALSSLGGVSPSSNTAEQVLGDIGWGRERVIASLFVVLGGSALALAAVGVYGVVSSLVTSRRRELAIRLALGAQRRTILELALRSTAVAVATGLAAGLLGSAVTHRLLDQWTTALAAGTLAKSSVFEVPSALVSSSVAAVIIAVAGMASAIPARRIASLRIAQTLRSE